MAKSIQDTNHSDDSGHVSLKTTRRGNGAQVTGAKENLIKGKKWRVKHVMKGEWLQKEN